MNKIGILGKGSGKGGIDQGKIDVFFSFFPFFLIFRCSLPTAMSISRSEILRRKKRTEVEKLMGDHGRSMGGHVRSVGVMGGQ